MRRFAKFESKLKIKWFSVSLTPPRTWQISNDDILSQNCKQRTNALYRKVMKTIKPKISEPHIRLPHALKKNWASRLNCVESTYVNVRNSDTVRGSLRSLGSTLGMVRYIHKSAIENIPKMLSTTINSKVVKGNRDIRLKPSHPLSWLGGSCSSRLGLGFAMSSAGIAPFCTATRVARGKGLAVPGFILFQEQKHNHQYASQISFSKSTHKSKPRSTCNKISTFYLNVKEMLELRCVQLTPLQPRTAFSLLKRNAGRYSQSSAPAEHAQCDIAIEFAKVTKDRERHTDKLSDRDRNR